MKNWSEEEMSILYTNYKNLSNREMIELLPNRTESSIAIKRTNLGLQKTRPCKIDKEECLRLHKEGMSVNALAEKYETYSKAVAKFLKEHGRYTGHKLWLHRYKVNENIFEIIDTEEKAYWLGFVLGDGSVDKYSLNLELGKVDVGHIEKFRTFIETDCPIKPTRKNCNYINIRSKKMISDLAKYGVVPNKTYKDIRTPNIDKALLKHFYRGILDSDGWVCFNQKKKRADFGFSSYNIEFLKEIQKYFYSEVGTIRGTLLERFRKNKTQRVCQLLFTGCKNFPIMFNHIYKDSKVYLDRKMSKSKEIVDYILSNPPQKRTRNSLGEFE